MLHPTVGAGVHRAIDRAVRWRLGASGYSTAPGAALEAVAAEAFWAASNVPDPAAVHVAATWRHRGATELRLEGPSSGPGGHRGSNMVIATAHLVDDAPAGTPLILVVHGYAIPLPFWDALQARALRRAGAHTLLIDLPFHLRRRLPGRASGDGYFGADPARTLASIRQSVEDAAAMVAWARSEVTPVVGVMGVSLGGLIALLLAAEVRLDAAVAVAPFCDPPLTFLELLPRNARRRVGLRAGGGGQWGADPAQARLRLDTVLAPIVPRNLVPRTDGDRVTVVQPLHDIIVGSEPIADLARAWGAELWEYPYGHITVMNAPGLSGRLRRRVLESAERSRGLARSTGSLFSPR